MTKAKGKIMTNTNATEKAKGKGKRKSIGTDKINSKQIRVKQKQ